MHRAVAGRACSLALKINYRPPAAIVGGVAKNTGVMHHLRQLLSSEITPLPVDPGIVGAMGAALLARNPLSK
ncbi:MAG: BadF/BadG/BcrA/BcrD ATPase family protein [Thermodesulfobacteriota bacterium]